MCEIRPIAALGGNAAKRADPWAEPFRSPARTVRSGCVTDIT